MLKTRFELEIHDHGVQCPRGNRWADVEVCYSCPSFRKHEDTRIVCEARLPQPTALDQSA